MTFIISGSTIRFSFISQIQSHLAHIHAPEPLCTNKMNYNSKLQWEKGVQPTTNCSPKSMLMFISHLHKAI